MTATDEFNVATAMTTQIPLPQETAVADPLMKRNASLIPTEFMGDGRQGGRERAALATVFGVREYTESKIFWERGTCLSSSADHDYDHDGDTKHSARSRIADDQHLSNYHPSSKSSNTALFQLPEIPLVSEFGDLLLEDDAIFSEAHSIEFASEPSHWSSSYTYDTAYLQVAPPLVFAEYPPAIFDLLKSDVDSRIIVWGSDPQAMSASMATVTTPHSEKKKTHGSAAAKIPASTGFATRVTAENVSTLKDESPRSARYKKMSILQAHRLFHIDNRIHSIPLWKRKSAPKDTPNTSALPTEGETASIIEAATVEKLVEKLTNTLDYTFMTDFFLTYRSFISPVQLCKLLILRFRWSLQNNKEERCIVRIRTFVVLRHWLLNYFVHDFIPDRELRIVLTSFLNALPCHPTIRRSKRDQRIVKGLKRVIRRLKKIYYSNSISERVQIIDPPPPTSEQERLETLVRNKLSEGRLRWKTAFVDGIDIHENHHGNTAIHDTRDAPVLVVGSLPHKVDRISHRDHCHSLSQRYSSNTLTSPYKSRQQSVNAVKASYLHRLEQEKRYMLEECQTKPLQDDNSVGASSTLSDDSLESIVTPGTTDDEMESDYSHEDDNRSTLDYEVDESGAWHHHFSNALSEELEIENGLLPEAHQQPLSINRTDTGSISSPLKDDSSTGGPRVVYRASLNLANQQRSSTSVNNGCTDVTEETSHASRSAPEYTPSRPLSSSPDEVTTAMPLPMVIPLSNQNAITKRAPTSPPPVPIHACSNRDSFDSVNTATNTKERDNAAASESDTASDRQVAHTPKDQHSITESMKTPRESIHSQTLTPKSCHVLASNEIMESKKVSSSTISPKSRKNSNNSKRSLLSFTKRFKKRSLSSQVSAVHIHPNTDEDDTTVPFNMPKNQGFQRDSGTPREASLPYRANSCRLPDKLETRHSKRSSVPSNLNTPLNTLKSAPQKDNAYDVSFTKAIPRSITESSTAFPPANAAHVPMHQTDLYASYSFLLKTRSDHIAQQLCLIERDILLNVDWEEMVHCRWTQMRQNHSVNGVTRYGSFDREQKHTFEPEAHHINYTKRTRQMQLARTTGKGGIEKIIERFNDVCQWVASVIVSTFRLSERVKVIEKFIRIAQKCKIFSNYATLVQILLGLQSPSVSRLHKTWSQVRHSEMSTLMQLSAFTSPMKNWKHIRDHMTNVAEEYGMSPMEVQIELSGTNRSSNKSVIKLPFGGCIPFLGIYLSDLVFNSEQPSYLTSQTPAQPIYTAYQTVDVSPLLKQPLVNFRKHRIVATVIKRVLIFQNLARRYAFEFNDELYYQCAHLHTLETSSIQQLASQIEPQSCWT
ncbi:ras guanine nucleotide exchange factor domain-containing protein [Radiomyces spectabilis]|uniref:ras guanine nucleotide exchange factor domain-containing protein n=1 Tax=Radiomyces spectabilis TaxID=64574 RepID=UPI00221EED0D|nr:ras guanine nucleotide exchange factor domain-containing protein [Radiomyces spectabilis]KAI8393436.1 ras guanine nucleotide exchange factor domain-containing protein [Radiomyces spectabilis]